MPNDIKQMSLKDAQVEISNKIYEATRLIEELEYAGKVSGNGHHARQKIAKFATDDLAERWN
jgi:hypothetical protein